MTVKISATEMNAFLDVVFPQIKGAFFVERLDETGCVMRMPMDESHLRPGGTISGPTMFTLADVAAYVTTMGQIGKQALAVTTGCSLDFMRKPEAGRDLIAHATLLKIGKSLSVTDILLYSDGKQEPVARATMTYSIPPTRS
ncbi:uncharacterized domain 1-containing protein [Shimia gijangensis]|uniref:Uncharacterized domain 1-containing protein n=1 Tax=Shimia gijangensis TaxID=1470563 RepID=A0A1M6HTD6_9RHOB|nr:PaaI family thioesterase [Shimia gijangensis]SHJ25398.1 uncharacterized domain 1-containing protein [Shimia gijangensis]